MTVAAEIVVRDGLAYVDVPDAELYKAAVDACAFKIEGAQYQARGKRWDGRTKLLSNNKVPVGLLDRVCRVLQLEGAEISVVRTDSQAAPKPKFETRLYDVKLRGYQQEAMLAAQLVDRGIFRMPTGSGKTIVALAMIAARRVPALVIVPTIDLLYQFKDEAAMHLVPGPLTHREERWHIGQLGDGVVDPQPITVTTIRTIAKVLRVAYETYEYAEYDDSDETDVDPRALKDWVESIGTLVVDEAHLLGAKTVFDVTTKIPALHKFGMSASPWRDDGADLMIEAATGPPIYYVPPKRLVQEGFLMAPEIRVIDTSKWWTSAAWGSTCTRCGKQWLQWTKECECGNSNFRSQYQESYNQEIVENPLRNIKLAQEIDKIAATGRTVLVLVRLIKHGRLLAEMMPEAIFLSGKDKGEDRQLVLERLRQNDLKILIATQIADMGLDIPQLGALVLAGGGKSSTRHLQRVGRVVRPAPGKLRPIVLDPRDSHVASWYDKHFKARVKIIQAEWGDLATWRYE